MITKTEMLDQSEKARVRISIESLLIDINEEAFAVAECLASAFSTDKPHAS